MRKNHLLFIALRYLALLLIALFGLPLIYAIFTPLTIYSLFHTFKLFYESIFISNSSLIIDGRTINLIPACIAGSAYLLLLILNLTTQLKAMQRAKSLAFLLGSFFLANVIRIVISIVLFMNNSAYFVIAHKIAWYFGSLVLVIILWFVNVYLFNIKAIPFITDIKTILKQAKNYKPHV